MSEVKDKTVPTTVNELIKFINDTRTQTSANIKDEVRVAQAMLNDPTYVVDIYNKDGVCGQYSPYNETRGMVASIIKDATKVSDEESKHLAENYKFGKNEAQAMVNFSKEYINTYLHTGRKLPLGTREKCNASLVLNVKPARVSSFPIPSGVDSNGNKIYNTTSGTIPSFETIKASSSCPKHLKNK